MKKIEATDAAAQSATVVADNIAELRALFPEVFIEGKINFDVFKQILGDNIDEHDEKYGLNWHGKRRARRLALTPSTGTLRPAPDDSVNWATTNNLFIEGDNLEALKLLQKSYTAQVQVIYIDPPYNTGGDFVYPDDFRDSIRNYLELTGQVDGGQAISSNTESSGRYHTTWLNMMYPRLRLARSLLKKEGVIYISIDDTEVARLRLLCDEIFGEENFLASICWERSDSPRMDAEYFSTRHDYIVAYAKNLEDFRVVRKPYEGAEIPTHFNKRDENNRLYYLKPLRAMGGQGETRAARPHLYFPIAAPDGTQVYPKLEGGGDGAWRWSRKKLADNLDRIEWSKATGRWSPSYRIYADESAGKPPETIFYNADVGSNRTSSAEVKALFDDIKVFDTPKPVDLIRRLIQISSDGDDLVMDFFAGSATTAHAVMQQNATDKKERRFILVQIPELLHMESKEQQVAATFCKKMKKPLNVAELAKERIRRAGKSLAKEYKGVGIDIGFRTFKLDSSNIRAWDPNRDNIAATLDAAVEHLKQDRTEQDILFELLLKLGLDLTVAMETKKVAGKDVHSIGAGVLLACLAEKIEKKDVEKLGLGIAEWHKMLAPAGETMVVFRDGAFGDDVAKSNLTAILQQRGLANVRSL